MLHFSSAIFLYAFYLKDRDIVQLLFVDSH